MIYCHLSLLASIVVYILINFLCHSEWIDLLLLASPIAHHFMFLFFSQHNTKQEHGPLFSSTQMKFCCHKLCVFQSDFIVPFMPFLHVNVKLQYWVRGSSFCKFKSQSRPMPSFVGNNKLFQDSKFVWFCLAGLYDHYIEVLVKCDNQAPRSPQ